jgi:PAS domain S-box-containing protein
VTLLLSRETQFLRDSGVRLRYNPAMLTNWLFARFTRKGKPSEFPRVAKAQRGGPHAWWSNAYLYTPLLSIIVFVIVMSLILWSLSRSEQVQQEDTLYRNVAWAQQQIRLSLTEAQEQVAALARDVVTGHADENTLTAPAGEMLNSHPEILGLAWFDAAGHARWLAPIPANSLHLKRPSPPELDAAMALGLSDVRESRRASYSPVFYDQLNNGYMTLQTPIFSNRTYLGSIAAVFSVEGMLRLELPVELSSRYKISILDPSGRELASSSSRPRLARDLFHDLPLDPPGNGLSVRVYAYPHTSNLINNRLLWLVAGLSCFVLWSLWSVWKHTRQRFVAQQQLFDEASFRRAMENSVLVGMRVLDLHGRITYVNPAFCRMTGWEESDLVDTLPPYAYWPPESFTEMRRQIDMTLRGKAPSSGFEMRVRRKDGSIFHARMYVSPLIDASGRQSGWMSSMTDISEPRRVREELSAAHERFTTVLESLDAAVSVLATDETQLLYANRYYRHVFGIRPDGHLELAGAGPYATSTTDDADDASDTIDMIDTYAGMPSAALTETASDSQEVYVKSVGKWFDVRRQYIQWVDGHLAQMQIASDITSRKEAQDLARQQDEKLQFASRLTTMGEMASSLAHELNQPLAAISNYCSGASALVRNGRASPETLLSALEKTSQQAIRAGMIIKRIREFVKRSEPKRKHARIGDIVADAIGLAEIETRKRGIRIVTEMRGRLPTISVDSVLIEQVLVNLLKNAAEAMADDRAKQVDQVPRAGARDQTIHLIVSSDPETVKVSVVDRGPGVDEALTERLFEPFFSTKDDGMGMGLNICRSIIESHRGRLWVENNVAPDGRVEGCTFHFTLPVTPDKVPGLTQADLYPLLNPTTLRENHE